MLRADLMKRLDFQVDELRKLKLSLFPE